MNEQDSSIMNGQDSRKPAISPSRFSPRNLLGKDLSGLAPAIIVWVVLAVWLAALLFERASWSEQADEATIREWLDEARPFRKSLPELARDYDLLRRQVGLPAENLREKREEIVEQMRALAEPTRVYLGQLPTFPVIYHLEVCFPEESTPSSRPAERLTWDSPLARPRHSQEHRVRELEFLASETGVQIRCEYQLHAFNKLQKQADEQRRESLMAAAVLVAATLLALIFTYRFWLRERQRDLERLQVEAEAEHRQRELLEIRIQQQEAARQRDELDRKLLEQELEGIKIRNRADQAIKEALEIKSQIYASIGIMAGSYAHNIKNLLVRPNDLLQRCLEMRGLPQEQEGMLQEIRATLGMVTDRLQQILRTVRRDPSQSFRTRLDLTAVLRDILSTWQELAREKWRIDLQAELPTQPVWISGDISHLQQAIENLIFNARDAIFEMRKKVRDQAHREPAADIKLQRQRLIEAAGWRGKIRLRLVLDSSETILEVSDNGIGMDEQVRRQCLQPHFSTKRENALFEGLNAGMGLGLSFVAVVLEHHHARLEIESTPGNGATFRIHFPLPETSPETDSATETARDWPTN